MRLEHLSQVARIAVVAAPRVRLASIGAIVDATEMARAHIRRQYGAVDTLPAADRFEVATLRVLAHDRTPVTTEGGRAVPVDGAIGGEWDVIWLANHDWTPSRQDDLPGHLALAPWLRAQADRGALIAASGTAVATLVRAGLADGRRVAAPLWLADRLRGDHRDVEFVAAAAPVEHGPILTVEGGVGDIAMAVAVVEAVTSHNEGLWLSRHLGLMPDEVRAAGGDTLLLRAQNWLSERYSQGVTVAELAAAMGVDRRTLHRHFVAATGAGPLAYLQSLRIEAAKRMLERTPFAVERIAALVGYGDTGFFRETFRRSAGVSPRRWRTAAREGAGKAPLSPL